MEGPFGALWESMTEHGVRKKTLGQSKKIVSTLP